MRAVGRILATVTTALAASACNPSAGGDLTYQRDLAQYDKAPVQMIYHLDMSYETEGGGTPEHLDTPGTRETALWYRLFASRPWQLLIPDRNHTTVTSGFGTWGSTDYVCAARASDGSTVIAYLPTGRSVTVDMRSVAGSQARAFW